MKLLQHEQYIVGEAMILIIRTITYLLCTIYFYCTIIIYITFHLTSLKQKPTHTKFNEFFDFIFVESNRIIYF